LLALLCAHNALGDPTIYFTNLGPGLRAPFGDTYGCLLGDNWKAELLIGSDPSAVQVRVGSATSFLSSNGCGTGLFNGGAVPVTGVETTNGTVYAQVRVWTGAQTFDEALATGAPFGWTTPVAVKISDADPAYLTGLTAGLVGPITPWFMIAVVSGNDVYFGPRLVVPVGHDLDFVVVKPDLAYRTPSNFRWQKLNLESNWVDLADANTNLLHLPTVGPNEAGKYRAIFNFGCGCVDEIAEAALTVIAVDKETGLRLNGPVGGGYRVDFTDALSETNNWQTLTNVVLSIGSVSGIDPEFANSSRRFYRILYSLW
jgi:hypothetical protein